LRKAGADSDEQKPGGYQRKPSEPPEKRADHEFPPLMA
jgi:hypothetical protein